MQFFAYKKRHQIKIAQVTKTSISHILYGFYGIKCLQAGVVKVNQLEVFRRIWSKILKRHAKIYIRIFFVYPITTKPILTRMGKGVGNIKEWVCIVKKGSILMEINSLDLIKIKKGFSLVLKKSPILVCLIVRKISLLIKA